MKSCVTCCWRIRATWRVDSAGAECPGRPRAVIRGNTGHEMSERFVPFWHRYAGQVRLEANMIMTTQKPNGISHQHVEERKSLLILANTQLPEKPCWFEAVHLQFFHAASAGVARSPCGVSPGSFCHWVESRGFDANHLGALSDAVATATTIR